MLHGNNKSADRPAHPCSLISAFFIHSLESRMTKLTTGKNSLFELVSKADQAGQVFPSGKPPRQGFSHQGQQFTDIFKNIPKGI